jgi:hypothetical protein
MAEYQRLGTLMRLRNFLRECRVIDVNDDEEFDFGGPLATALNRPLGVAPGPIEAAPERRAVFTSSPIHTRPQLLRQLSTMWDALNQFGLEAEIFTFNPPAIEFKEEQPSHFLPKEAAKETHAFQLKLITLKPTPDWECTICFDANPIELALHPSGCHSFHHICIEEWLWRSPACPMCRAKITPLTVLPK